MTRSAPIRIVVINQYFPPDTSATARVVGDAVDALTAAGHSVTVIAGRPSYHPSSRRPWRLVQSESYKMARVDRVGSSAFDRHMMSGRIVNYLSYALLALIRALFTRSQAILAMTDPPISPIIGAIVALIHRVPLVVNVRDLHPDMAIAGGMVRRGAMTFTWERLTRWALRRATRVIVLGEDMRRRVIAKGVPSARVVVVRDGAELMPDRVEALPNVAEVRGHFAFVVMHAGNVGFAGDWDSVLGAAEQLEGSGVGFVFVGSGAATDRIHSRAADHRNVRLVASRPVEQVSALLEAGDLQLVTLRDGLDGLVVPSKLYPILMAGRPVLAVVPEESDVAAIVREANCGWVVRPGNADGVANAVREAVAEGESLAAYGRRARAAGSRFDRRALMLDLVSAVEGAVAP